MVVLRHPFLPHVSNVRVETDHAVTIFNLRNISGANAVSFSQYCHVATVKLGMQHPFLVLPFSTMTYVRYGDILPGDFQADPRLEDYIYSLPSEDQRKTGCSFILKLSTQQKK